jgi:hypothetical protein
MSSILLRACATILNGAAISLVAHPALAADAANEESTAAQPVLFEVVVTAQKREQRAQDVPISVAVMGGGDLDRSSLKPSAVRWAEPDCLLHGLRAVRAGALRGRTRFKQL